MNDIIGFIIRIIFELIIFIVIYYFILNRWNKKTPKETLKKSIVTGLIWVTVYELILYLFHVY